MSGLVRVLSWDVAPTFKSILSKLLLPFGSVAPLTWSRNKWRVSTWWPSDDANAVQRSLLRLLATAHRERLDLATLISNFADEHRGWWRFRLRRLASRIQTGTSLGDAIEQTPDVIKESDGLAIRFAIQSGVLPAAFEELLQDTAPDRRLADAALWRVLAYLVSMIVAIAFIAMFMWTLILPMLHSLGDELGITLPWSIRSQAQVRDWLANFWWLWLPVAMVIGVCLDIRRAGRSLLRAFTGWSLRLGLSSRPAELLRLLALATASGRPISSSLSTLARYHFDKVIRHKLLFIRNEVEQGADVWRGLSDASLITPQEAEAIRLCPDANTQAWLLRRLAAAKTTATTLRRQTIAAWTQPAVVLLFGAIVAWMATGYFQFLSQILSAIQSQPS